MTEHERKNDKLWLSGFGNDEAKILILSSNPSGEDAMNHELHWRSEELESYNGADELMRALQVAGVNLEDCFFTTVVKYSIGSKDKPTPAQVEECYETLEEELKHIKPKLIIALGAEAFKRIMQSNIKVSDYLGEIIECPYGHVMANYSPGQVWKIDPTLRPDFIDNFVLAKRFAEGTLKYVPFETQVVNSVQENTRILQDYIDRGCFSIGYDAEWKGKYQKDEQMYTFQYSCEPHKAIVLPIIKIDADGKRVENLELLNSMKIMLEHPKADRLGWNIRADDKRLRDRGFKLPEHTLGFDGMKAMAFVDSRFSKGLEVGIKRFTNYRPYYNELTKALRAHKLGRDEMSELFYLEPEIFINYCGGDAVSHRTACLAMREALPKMIGPDVVKYYNEVYLPLSNYLLDMEVYGLPIDIECMKKLTDQFKECYDILFAQLLEQTKAYGFNTQIFENLCKEHTEEEVKAAGYRKDFNPRSFIDKNRLFFELMKLEPAYYVRKGKAKPKAWYDKVKETAKAGFRPSANGKSMASIRFGLAAELQKDPNNKKLKQKYDIVSTYLDLARVSVFSGKFLSTQGINMDDEEEAFDADDSDGPLKSSYWSALGNDNRIHADFFECLDNFRSSSKPNVQNPASKVLSHMPGIFSKCGLEAPKNIRNIFYSGHPDWYFAEVDVAGADLAIAAFLSKDQDYINDILKGGFHATKMREYFKDQTLTKDNASKYVTSKSITFRVAYTAGLKSAALPIQAEIFAESGELVDIELIEYALLTWERYKTYINYRKECQRQVVDDCCIYNLRGMPFKFEKTAEMNIQAGWMNQSLAYPIASELALFMWDLSVKLKKAMQEDGVWNKYIFPVNVVHDANYWVIHKDLMNDDYFPEICKQYFTKEVKIATGDNLGMEMVVADCWKGKNKIFSKETKWNFQKKEWEWEH